MPRPLPTSILLFLLFGLAVLNISVYQRIYTPHTLEITVREAGKGRVVLIRQPSGVVALINTGSDASIVRILGNALPPWKRTVEMVVLTAANTATLGGLPELIGRYHISNLIRFGTLGSLSMEKALSVAESASRIPRPLTEPYGTDLILDRTHLSVVSADRATISYGSTFITISSTTPAGKYTLDGATTTYLK